MHATASTTIIFVLLLLGVCHPKRVLPLSIESVPVCTPDQEAAFKPYQYCLDSPGCDESSFRTCSDGCLAERQRTVQNAPNCDSVNGSMTTYHDRAVTMLKACENARANTTNKYIPQTVADAPICDPLESSHFNTGIKIGSCSRARRYDKCSDECLKLIESTISTAPPCRASGSEYMLGESVKYLLVDCLNARKEDLKQNTVLNTVVAVSTNSATVSATPAAVLAVGLVALVFTLA